jgi:hypothetical protein
VSSSDPTRIPSDQDVESLLADLARRVALAERLDAWLAAG